MLCGLAPFGKEFPYQRSSWPYVLADAPPCPCDALLLRGDPKIAVFPLENNLVASSDAKRFANRGRKDNPAIFTNAQSCFLD